MDNIREEAFKRFLRKEYNATEEDIDSITEEKYYDNGFSSSLGDFLVLTDDEADEYAHDNVFNLYDDIGIDGFNVEISDFVDDYYFEEAKEEMDRNYCDDIIYENSNKFENRLVEEIYDRGGIEDTDFKISEDGSPDYNECLLDESDLITRMMDIMDKDFEKNYGIGRDYISWFIDEFGEEEFNEFIKQRDLVDVEKLIDYVIRSDGRGSIISCYDGEEYVTEAENGDEFFIYRIN